MTKLSVNVNKIALLRNARKLDVPNVVRLSELALKAGASGITIHPRPDERHIKAKDVIPLSRLVAQFEMLNSILKVTHSINLWGSLKQ